MGPLAPAAMRCAWRWHAGVTMQLQQACSNLTARRFSGLSNVIEAEAGITQLQGYYEAGFIIDNTQVAGPVLCSNSFWTCWSAASMQALTPDSLALVDVLQPRPDLVILGTGAHMQRLSPAVQDFLRQRNIATEVLDTRNAVSYFNFMCNEGRPVLAAMLPVGLPEDWQAQQQQQQQKEKEKEKGKPQQSRPQQQGQGQGQPL